MFKTILVPTDGSEYAGRAEDMAISIASKFDARIVGVYVLMKSLFILMIFLRMKVNPY